MMEINEEKERRGIPIKEMSNERVSQCETFYGVGLMSLSMEHR